MTLEERLADFAINATPPTDLEPVVRGRLLDTIGVGIANSREPLLDQLLAADEESGAASATIWGRRERVSALSAALLNGALAHGSDFDDTQGESGVHASAPVVAAAYAAAERAAATGPLRQFLDAVAVGLEVSIRLGAVSGHRLGARGFHATPVIGVHGAAAATARVLGLDARQAADALRLASSLASGLLQFLVGGGDVKPIHAGWAVRAGYQASLWAKAGIRGPAGALEGQYGLYRSFVAQDSDVDVNSAISDLGVDWRANDGMFKRYPCCHFLQAPIDAALALTGQGASVEELARAVVLIPPEGIGVVCEPDAAKRRPSDAYAAKFSAPYVVALALADGAINLDSFSPRCLKRGELRPIIDRVEWRELDSPAADGFSYPGGVELHLRDGSIRRKVLTAPAPMDRAALINKVNDCTSRSGISGQQLVELVENDAHIGKLSEAMCP